MHKIPSLHSSRIFQKTVDWEIKMNGGDALWYARLQSSKIFSIYNFVLWEVFFSFLSLNWITKLEWNLFQLRQKRGNYFFQCSSPNDLTTLNIMLYPYINVCLFIDPWFIVYSTNWGCYHYLRMLINLMLDKWRCVRP